MTEASERAAVGLARVLQIQGEDVTYRHERAGTTETVTVAFVETGQGDETGAAFAVLETSSLATAALEGDHLVRADGLWWFVERILPTVGTVQQLGVVIARPSE